MFNTLNNFHSESKCMIIGLISWLAILRRNAIPVTKGLICHPEIFCYNKIETISDTIACKIMSAVPIKAQTALMQLEAWAKWALCWEWQFPFRTLWTFCFYAVKGVYHVEMDVI